MYSAQYFKHLVIMKKEIEVELKKKTSVSNSYFINRRINKCKASYQEVAKLQKKHRIILGKIDQYFTMDTDGKFM